MVPLGLASGLDSYLVIGADVADQSRRLRPAALVPDVERRRALVKVCRQFPTASAEDYRS